jgi:branched-chain amino acid transport system ATP-binding protein
MLQLDKLDVYYGAIQALKGVSLEVQKNEVVAIIGSNGAGKSTLLRALSGMVKPRRGSILFEGKRIIGKRADEIVKLGMSHCPEGRRIFINMTVLENLQLGAHIRRDKEVQQDLERVLSLFPRLRERLTQNAGTLSGGEQQMLAIGRALMCRPKLLMLDEPSLGLAPNLVLEIFKIIEDINQQGVTVLLVEQNAHMALEIAHRAYVLETGTVVLSDTGESLLNNPRVKEAYLGA